MVGGMGGKREKRRDRERVGEKRGRGKRQNAASLEEQRAKREKKA